MKNELLFQVKVKCAGINHEDCPSSFMTDISLPIDIEINSVPGTIQLFDRYINHIPNDWLDTTWHCVDDEEKII